MSEPKPVVPGTKYNMLTVIEEMPRYVQPNGRTRRVARVSCDCGNVVDVMLENLYAGYSKSCGCVLKEKIFKHGMSKTSFKECHVNMKARCDNPKHPQYSDYGGRGISYCEKWARLTGFIEDMLEGYKKGLSLDRIDVNGNYELSNCRWTCMGVQGHNKRKKEDTLFKSKGVRINNGNPDTVVASIQVKGRSCYLACFVNESDAAKAYDDASEILYQDRPNRTQAVEDWIYEKVKAKLILKGIIDGN